MNRADSDSSGRFARLPMPQPWTLLRGASFAGKAKHPSPRRSKLRHTKVAGLEGPVTGVVGKEKCCCCLRPAWTWTRSPDLSQNINDAPQLRLYSAQRTCELIMDTVLE